MSVKDAARLTDRHYEFILCDLRKECRHKTFVAVVKSYYQIPNLLSIPVPIHCGTI